MSFAAFSELPLTTQPQEELATQLLQEFNGDLTPPLHLRALCSACGDRETDLLCRLNDIIAAAEDHRSFDEPNESPVSKAYGRSQAAVALSWPLGTLIHNRHIHQAVQLLSAWLPAAPTGPLISRPLFMLPTSVVGTLWATQSRIAPDPAGTHLHTLADLNAVIQSSFNTDLTLRSDRSWMAADQRTGYPVMSTAEDFEQIARRHLRLDQLRIVSEVGASPTSSSADLARAKPGLADQHKPHRACSGPASKQGNRYGARLYNITVGA
jgi:hypothetical protein